MKDKNDLRCPFCDESEFDIYGLKMHLQLWCDEYKNIAIPKGVINLSACDSMSSKREKKTYNLPR